MKILALIPARGGSKRLPNKNIEQVGGIPMIIRTLEVAKQVQEISATLISTDEISIAKICEEAGYQVPWLRPPELAMDETTSVDVALHALDCYERDNSRVDALLLLQPTSPFRTVFNIKKAIELFHENNFQPVVSVSPSQSHPMWTLKLDGEYAVPYMTEHGFGQRSQDLPELFTVNGCVYLITTDDLRGGKTFVPNKCIPLIMESEIEALDIDTKWDLDVANFFARNQSL